MASRELDTKDINLTVLVLMPALMSSTQASKGSTKANKGSTKANKGSTQASKGSTKANKGSTQASKGSTVRRVVSPKVVGRGAVVRVLVSVSTNPPCSPYFVSDRLVGHP